ncbi:hypothetical protein BU14_0141s0003 [Porphyra umbilicalis]|uniref:Uncharacterized protein n=1 Tax=Porphyra umbilicalis TaxID=2786 RepID=A0A1X6P9T0_PORUM|nr:hypothetical protein BU14_0141s0003 [Porphyra umbilicalis]|eukprot:OSX77618.1 hypothetical protein BU14_0141s0003 [Porphyra umbilicalis]
MDGADGSATSDGDRRVVWATGIASAVLFAFAITAAVSGERRGSPPPAAAAAALGGLLLSLLAVSTGVGRFTPLAPSGGADGDDEAGGAAGADADVDRWEMALTRYRRDFTPFNTRAAALAGLAQPPAEGPVDSGRGGRQGGGGSRRR